MRSLSCVTAQKETNIGRNEIFTFILPTVIEHIAVVRNKRAPCGGNKMFTKWQLLKRVVESLNWEMSIISAQHNI